MGDEHGTCDAIGATTRNANLFVYMFLSFCICVRIPELPIN